MPSYNPTNVFAKIIRGELPAHKVYEDDKAFAFLDIMPRAPGHTLVIPKAPARTILDIEPDDLAHVINAKDCAFFMHDGAQVNVELVSGWLRVAQPGEVEMYADVFGRLAEMAVYGNAARTLINHAIGAIG